MKNMKRLALGKLNNSTTLISLKEEFEFEDKSLNHINYYEDEFHLGVICN